MRSRSASTTGNAQKVSGKLRAGLVGAGVLLATSLLLSITDGIGLTALSEGGKLIAILSAIVAVAADLFTAQLERKAEMEMTNEPRFENAFPYQQDILALPVTDLDAASAWYCAHFGMVEAERRQHPQPTVILERDGTKIGFCINGGDASQDGAAILVSNIQGMKD
jgi:hypothetical protein